jgi:hypothetical protein
VVAWFRIAFAEKAFIRILGNHGWTLEQLSVDEGVAAMLEFYREHRAQHTDLDDEGDMLLVQWGNGMLDLTRQLIRSGSPDNPIRQLSLTFQVAADLPEPSNQWFDDPTQPIEVPPFFTGMPIATRLTYGEA